MILEILVGAFILLIAYWYYEYKNIEKYLVKFKGPTPLPIFGNAYYFRSNDIILNGLLELHKYYGGVVKLSLGIKSVYLSIADVQFLEFLFSSTKLIDKSRDYEFMHRWLGLGLLTSTGEKWKKHRRIITPAYHFKILEQFTDVFEKFSNIMVTKLHSEIGKDSTNIYPYITLCSLDIICASSMGTEVNAQDDSESEYVKSVKEMCRIIIDRGVNLFKMNDSLYTLSKDYQKELKAVNILHNYTNSVIRSRTKEIERENAEKLETFDEESEIRKKRTLLDLLLNYKMENGTITNENIREEVDTFMFEGHDTTSSAISFSLYCIANYQEVQAKIIEELVEIFGDDMTRPASYRDLQDMKYLEKVIKETLRLYPSVPMFSRFVNESTKYGDIVLPKGLQLFVNVFSIHRDPKIYPDPEKFDPERFSLENTSKRSPFAYVPFSAGSRNCIGQKFAMLEMKAVISKVLKNYQLLPSIPQHNLILVPETILTSTNGVNIRIKERIF